MKKCLLFILILAVSLALAGCGKEELPAQEEKEESNLNEIIDREKQKK